MPTEIIIGGSRGIGRAYLERRLGQSLLINLSRTPPPFTHEGLSHYPSDITRDELPELPAADHLLYLPGSINLKPFGSLSEKEFLDDFAIHVMGGVRAIKRYLPLLRQSDQGSITLFSTVAVAQGMPFHASVAVAKAGVEALCRTLAAELAPKVRVNCLSLTMTDTPLAERLLRSEKAREAIAERQPLKRILNPEEVAEMAEFITLKATGMTGQVIGLDLGLSTLRP